ncbi:MAG: hypothetical protein P8X87_04575 [Candidatus Bathyarchaeota archaeon]
MTAQLTESLKENILNICKDVAGSRKITAVCVYGPWACGYANKKTDINVLLVLERFLLRLQNHYDTNGDTKISVLIVNRSDFERDIKKGWLGEFCAERLLLPYVPLINSEYLESNEKETKKRIIMEILGNVVLEFPESSYDFSIKNEYFMYETMMRKAKLFPPLAYVFHNVTQKNGDQNIKNIMDGYLKAFKELEKENIIALFDDHIKITAKHIEAIKNWKNKIPVVIKFLRRMTVTPLLRMFSETADSFIQERRLFSTDNKNTISANHLVSQLEDPRKYVLLPTPLGVISLADKSDITDVAKKLMVADKFSKIEIKKIGGVFNDIYLLTITKNDQEKVAKAHSLGVTLGDCKPENFMVTEKGIFLLDLEQASRKGNKTWDVAEFLYFSGHYSPAMSPTTPAIIIAKSFIEGYLQGGGDKKDVIRAASPKYTKVFTVFTAPHILLAMSNICKKT